MARINSRSVLPIRRGQLGLSNRGGRRYSEALKTVAGLRPNYYCRHCHSILLNSALEKERRKSE